jgi:hypothetical protein
MVTIKPIDLGGSTSTESTTSPDDDKPDDQLVREAIGSGSVTTTVDDDGRATQTIDSIGTGSAGGFNDTPDGTEGETEVARSTSTTTIEDQTEVEQAIEDATGGRAFLDPDETDTISDRETYNTTENSGSGGGSDPFPTNDEGDGFPPWLVAAAAAGGLLLIYKVIL